MIRGGYAPVVARLPRAWDNPVYKRPRREGLVAVARDLAPPPTGSLEELAARRPVVIPDHVPDDLVTRWDDGGFPWS